MIIEARSGWEPPRDKQSRMELGYQYQGRKATDEDRAASAKLPSEAAARKQ